MVLHGLETLLLGLLFPLYVTSERLPDQLVNPDMRLIRTWGEGFGFSLFFLLGPGLLESELNSQAKGATY